MTFKIFRIRQNKYEYLKIPFLEKIFLEAGDIVNNVQVMNTGQYIAYIPLPDMGLDDLSLQWVGKE